MGLGWKRRHTLISFWLLIAVGSTPASAQDFDPYRYTPLEPGNMWLYEVEPIAGRGPGAFISYEVELVDTLIDDRQNHFLTIKTFASNWRVICSVREVFYWDGERFSRDDLEPYDCHDSVIPFPVYHLQPKLEPTTIAIGGKEYMVPATAKVYWSYHSSHGFMGHYIQSLAMDIGVYDYEYDRDSGGPFPTTTTWKAILTYAKVGDKEYGLNKLALPVDDAPIPGDHEVVALSVYPNPFEDVLYIKADGLEDGPGHVVLYDLMGRPVATQDVQVGQLSINLEIMDLPA